jgi:hypothetical protein
VKFRRHYKAYPDHTYIHPVDTHDVVTTYILIMNVAVICTRMDAIVINDNILVVCVLIAFTY